MKIVTRLDELKNESDVEQKLIYPLLVSPHPTGLGFQSECIFTKPNLARLLIEKGASAKRYHPDYLISVQNIPCCVIEVKSPSEDLLEAFREARMYATEINSKFPSGVNPCDRILVSNGAKSFWGSSDSQTPDGSFELNEISAGHINFEAFIEKFCFQAMHKHSEDLLREVRKDKKFSNPLSLLGGASVKHQQIKENSFSDYLQADLRFVFNPVTRDERVKVAKYAYVKSQKREKHADPINKIIKASIPASILESTLIKDSSEPKELVEKLNYVEQLRNEIILLVGSVGAGKSTFVDHFIEVNLPENVAARTVWVRLDLNLCPLSRDEVYNWILNTLTEKLKDLYSDLEFDALDNILKIYSPEVKKFKTGIGSLLERNEQQYQHELYKKLESWQSDKIMTTRSLIRFLCTDRNKTLMVVLDNCDKRTSEDQLLMFEVARWVKEELRTVVFLPMRDITYDLFRKLPPLDTVQKDLVFRIDAPRLEYVIYKRIEYALRQINDESDGGTDVELANGMRIIIPGGDRASFFKSILSSIFQTDTRIKNLITGLAGRNIRKGLEIFYDLCSSGHIREDVFVKIRTSGGESSIPWPVLIRALMRKNRKYYLDETSEIKNLFQNNNEDELPNPYLRFLVLAWLKSNYSHAGPCGTKGFHRVKDIALDFRKLGCEYQSIYKETLKLIEAGCVFFEENIPKEMTIDNVKEALICISPSGFVHLDLVRDQNYLSTCAESIWYEDRKQAERIRRRIVGEVGEGQFHMNTILLNAKELITYLGEFKNKYIIPGTDLYTNGSKIELLEEVDKFEEIDKNLDKRGLKFTPDEIIGKFPIGNKVNGTIVHIAKRGIIIDLGEVQGWIDLFNKNGNFVLADYSVGDELDFNVLGFNESFYKVILMPIN